MAGLGDSIADIVMTIYLALTTRIILEISPSWYLLVNRHTVIVGKHLYHATYTFKSSYKFVHYVHSRYQVMGASEAASW